MDYEHGHTQPSQGLRWLLPVIKGWIKANRRYARMMKGADALYWFNERASVSTLEAGAWVAKRCAIKEYTSPKISADGSGHPAGQISTWRDGAPAKRRSSKRRPAG